MWAPTTVRSHGTAGMGANAVTCIPTTVSGVPNAIVTFLLMSIIPPEQNMNAPTDRPNFMAWLVRDGWYQGAGVAPSPSKTDSSLLDMLAKAVDAEQQSARPQQK